MWPNGKLQGLGWFSRKWGCSSLPVPGKHPSYDALFDVFLEQKFLNAIISFAPLLDA
jgi:hypothetical protein